jgi:methylmalonyl-CoA mutase N-terminal domain/subunit
MNEEDKKKYSENKKRYFEKAENIKTQDIDFTTISSESVNPLYAPDDIQDLDYNADLGFPGEYPYTRGVYPNMYRGRFWTMRQFAGFGSARDTNGRYHYLMDHGQTGLSVAFDMPTIMGYDSDHERSLGEVGKCGVAIDSLRDMEILFDEIDLSKITTSMTINAPASILLSFYLAAGEKKGIGFHEMGGTIQNDILKEYIAQKSWIFPPEPSMRIITDVLEFCTRNVPKWNTISISGYHIREAGSTAAQELAFTLADGFAYVEAGIKAGLDVDDFAPRLSFFFNAHLDFFEEIAKYRAARIIWAKRMKEKYGAKKNKSLLLRFHTQTAGCSLTAQQPENNIVRTAFQGLSAVLGGTQSLHTNSMDETLALPSEKAVRIALRTQQIIAHETGVVNTIDPLAGSYFIEAKTREMKEKAEDYFQKIDRFGGVIKAIEKGFFQKEISKAAYEYQKLVESRKKIIVGLNKFAMENEEIDIPILKINPEVEKNQRKAIAGVREERDNDKVKRELERLRKAAESTDNLVPVILDCAKCYCTEGEIISELKEIFGEYQEPIFL